MMGIRLFQQQDEPDDERGTARVEETATIRCLTQEHFVALREIEAQMGGRFQRALADDWLIRLDPGILYPIIETVPLNAGVQPAYASVVRCHVMLSDVAIAWVDVPSGFYDNLPMAEAAPAILAMLITT